MGVERRAGQDGPKGGEQAEAEAEAGAGALLEPMILFVGPSCFLTRERTVPAACRNAKNIELRKRVVWET